jgi:ABC-type transporter Mla subunit MlaD
VVLGGGVALPQKKKAAQLLLLVLLLVVVVVVVVLLLLLLQFGSPRGKWVPYFIATSHNGGVPAAWCARAQSKLE